MVIKENKTLSVFVFSNGCENVCSDKTESIALNIPMMRLSGTKSPCGAKSFLHRQISLY
jgi:hypothetical protein